MRDGWRTGANGRRMELLLVEDNPGDVLFTKEALEDTSVPVNLSVAVDGEQALAFLHRRGNYREAPRPDLVLLDLNLPKVSGMDVLAEMKSDVCLRSIPVVIFTTSTAEEDIARTYDLHANSYITKPLEFSGYAVALQAIERFWLTTATLPSA